jgi:hypothetical protein
MLNVTKTPHWVNISQLQRGECFGLEEIDLAEALQEQKQQLVLLQPAQLQAVCTSDQVVLDYLDLNAFFR